MILKFKQAKVQDLQKVLDIFKVAAEKVQKRGTQQWQHWLNPTPELLERVKNNLHNKQFFFVYHADETVGMFRLMDNDDEYWDKNEDSARYIHSFVTLPKYAGQGIGSAALTLIARKVAAQNIPLLRLDCKADNLSLCNYYEQQGFAKVRLQEMPHYAVQLFEKKL
ncbi:MAG: GNAT family N-acetyltransferase [Saprospiraceae bacterium]|nr:GNAT family N-acetyltransferase [Saprospiraceae bacterium]